MGPGLQIDVVVEVIDPRARRLSAVQVLLGEVPGELAVIDCAAMAFPAGKTFIQVKFVVYRGAISSWGNRCRIAEKAGKLMLKDMSKTPSKVRWHIVFVSEVGGDLRAFYGERIPTPRAAAN